MNQPNLLFVFADQWRRMAMGCAQQDAVLTPNMDSFAAQSIYCTNAISTFPLCSPHRACLFTGRWPHANGVFTNCKPGLSVRMQDSEICIGQVLKENGYQTGYIGKWHLDEPEINHQEAPASGARNWDAYTPPGVRRHGFDFWHSYGACDEHLTPHYWNDTEEKVEIDKWSPEHETDVAIDYLQNCDKTKPFSLFVSWNPPHSPYNQVPSRYLDLYRDKELPLRANVDYHNIHHHTTETANLNTPEELMQVTREYFAAVSGLDDQFARLLKTLEEQGLRENTIVVLTADHGDMMGSHALMAKHVWYEESVGIPFVIGGAGLQAGVCNTTIGSADVAPTLLSLLQLPIPPQMQGIDRAAEIKAHTVQDDSFTYLYATPGGPGLLGPLKQAGIDPRSIGWRGIRSPRYTYIADAGYTPQSKLRRLLYDLQEDPYQLNPQEITDLAQNAVAKKMEQQLQKWLLQQQDDFRFRLNA
ncbi:MAG: sulfatase [Oscillospiraceae bacterium]|nr:sulfatase [Oscillospiraceae bacterium]